MPESGPAARGCHANPGLLAGRGGERGANSETNPSEVEVAMPQLAELQPRVGDGRVPAGQRVNQARAMARKPLRMFVDADSERSACPPKRPVVTREACAGASPRLVSHRPFERR